MTNSVPDSFSQADLEQMLKRAPKDSANSDAKKASEGPFNGHGRKELVRDVRSSIEKLDEKYNNHPMVMKTLVIENLCDLISMHSDFGVQQFKDGDEKAAVCWLRDAGKLQAALSQMLEVELPDDFTIPE